MRREYDPEEIFVLSLVLGSVSLTSLVWPYLGLVTAMVVLWVWCKKRKWDFWEWLDVVGPLSLLLAAVLSWTQGLSGWPAGIISFAGWWLVLVLTKFYRQFGWYKSGRLGFVGIVSLGWWGVIQLMVANISLWAVYSLVWIVIVTGVALYLRSGRRISQDLKLWPVKKPKARKG